MNWFQMLGILNCFLNDKARGDIQKDRVLNDTEQL